VSKQTMMGIGAIAMPSRKPPGAAAPLPALGELPKLARKKKGKFAKPSPGGALVVTVPEVIKPAGKT
jgi:hypothetical protein